MKRTTELSQELARRIALDAQLLSGSIKLPMGKEGVAQAIGHLGYIQIDTIAVVKRAHHHTLWNRLPDYSENMLHELHAKDRRVFEYWGHAASFLPIKDYRFYLPLMKSFEDPKMAWQKRRYEKYSHLMAPVLERIRKEGPLGSRDFDPPPGTKRGAWWDWKP
ncbi:winged helix DNA-binding domain-containing protein, partial [bacterium]|nr:winged helix DNA-binding domain-containing protein [bacterium]